jgi:stage II sporulation protein R
VLRLRLITVGVIIIIFFGVGLLLNRLGRFNTGICTAYNRANLIRLHVVANSDSAADQTLKLKVRDRVLQVSEAFLLRAPDPEKAETLLRKNLPLLATAVRDELARQARPMPVKVQLGEFEFPTKAYPFGVLEAGRYKGLRVVLGAGLGHNWWCVMYPPLCLLSADPPPPGRKSKNKPVKVEYKLAILEKLVRNKGLTMNQFLRKWSESFGML